MMVIGHQRSPQEYLIWRPLVLLGLSPQSEIKSIEVLFGDVQKAPSWYVESSSQPRTLRTRSTGLSKTSRALYQARPGSAHAPSWPLAWVVDCLIAALWFCPDARSVVMRKTRSLITGARITRLPSTHSPGLAPEFSGRICPGPSDQKNEFCSIRLVPPGPTTMGLHGRTWGIGTRQSPKLRMSDV